MSWCLLLGILLEGRNRIFISGADMRMNLDTDKGRRLYGSIFA